jgi:hypothetical protein
MQIKQIANMPPDQNGWGSSRSRPDLVSAGGTERLEFHDALTRFVRTYSFVSQIAAFTDPALEGDYVFCRALSLYLRDTGTVERLDLGSEVELTHLRHQMTFSGALSLTFETGEVRSFFGEWKGVSRSSTWSGSPASWRFSTTALGPT